MGKNTEIINDETIFAKIDKSTHVLSICGKTLEELIAKPRTGNLIHLYWSGLFDDIPDGEELQEALGWARVQVFQHVKAIDDSLLELSDSEILRALIARLPDGDSLETAFQLLAAPAVFVPAIHHLRLTPLGQNAIRPNPNICHDADILRMFHGGMPDEDTLIAFNAYLLAATDCRYAPALTASQIVASTGAGFVSSVVSALSALKGITGDPEKSKILSVLDAMAYPERAEGWIKTAIKEGNLNGILECRTAESAERIKILKQALELALRNPNENTPDRVALTGAIETAAERLSGHGSTDQDLLPSVAFYSELLLEQLGVEPSAYTNILAQGHMIEWIACARHAQRSSGSQK